MNILVVEDNDIDVEILRRGLDATVEPNQLVRARDGREALDLLARQSSGERVLDQPFLILLDINMPGMNGHEFLESLRRSPEMSDHHVFVFSTSSDMRDVTRAYRNHAAGYLVKPCNRDDLKSMLGTLRDFWFTCEHSTGHLH